MSKTYVQLIIAIAGIVALGQACAKDMTTQDFDAELAAENMSKMQVHAGTYTGSVTDSSGNVVGAMTTVVVGRDRRPGREQQRHPERRFRRNGRDRRAGHPEPAPGLRRRVL